MRQLEVLGLPELDGRDSSNTVATKATEHSFVPGGVQNGPSVTFSKLYKKENEKDDETVKQLHLRDIIDEDSNKTTLRLLVAGLVVVTLIAVGVGVGISLSSEEAAEQQEPPLLFPPGDIGSSAFVTLCNLVDEDFRLNIELCVGEGGPTTLQDCGQFGPFQTCTLIEGESNLFFKNGTVIRTIEQSEGLSVLFEAIERCRDSPTRFAVQLIDLEFLICEDLFLEDNSCSPEDFFPCNKNEIFILSEETDICDSGFVCN